MASFDGYLCIALALWRTSGDGRKNCQNYSLLSRVLVLFIIFFSLIFFIIFIFFIFFSRTSTSAEVSNHRSRSRKVIRHWRIFLMAKASAFFHPGPVATETKKSMGFMASQPWPYHTPPTHKKKQCLLTDY